MIKATVDIRMQGTVWVSDKWTDDEISANPDGFDEEIIEALPDNMNSMSITVEDAWTEEKK